MTTVLNGFEGLTSGTTLTAANTGGSSGNAFDTVGSATTPPTATSGGSRGSVCMSAYNSNSAFSSYAQWTSAGTFGAQTTVYFRLYAKLSAFQGATGRLFNITTGAGSVCTVNLSTSGKIGVTYGTAGTAFVTFTGAVPIGSWFRVEGLVVVSATTGQVSVSLFSTSKDAVTPDETHTSASTINTGTLSGTTTYSFGNSSAVNQTSAILYDDVGLSTTGPLGPSTISGTGSGASRKPSVSSTGIQKIAGSGSAAARKPSLSSTAAEKIPGTASVAARKPSISSTGTEKVSGTASVASRKPSLSSTASEKIAGTGSLSSRKPSISATSAEKISGSGSVAARKPSLVSAGKEKITSSASVVSRKPSISSAGTVNTGDSASGSVASRKPAIAAAGKETIAGSGSVASRKSSVLASGGILSVINNAEGGTNGTGVTTGNSGSSSGTAFNTVSTGTGSTITFDNTHAAHGSLSYKILVGSPSVNTVLEWTTSLVVNTAVQTWFRAYLYVTANPANALRFIRARNGSTTCASVGMDSSGHIQVLDASSTAVKTSTSTVPLNKWFRLEGYFTGDASVGQIECRMFTSAQDNVAADETLTTTATQNTNGPINQLLFGNPASVATYTFWMDDLAASTVRYIGPAAVAGAASLAASKPSVLAAGSEKIAGTGSLRARKPSVASSGVVYFSTLRNTFEGVSNGTTLTAANSGGVSGNPFDAVSIPAAGVLAADNSHPGLGTISLKSSTTTTTGTPAAEWLLASLGIARTLLYFRVDCFKTASAVPGWRPLTFRTTGGTHIMSVIISGNTAGISYGSGFTGLTSFVSSAPNNQWFRMEGWIDTVAGTIHAELYRVQNQAVPDEQHTYTSLVLGTPIQRIDVGNGNSSTADGPFWIDEVGVSSMGPMSPASLAVRKPYISAAGSEKITGIVSIASRKPSIAATAGETDGRISVPKPSITGIGKEKISGSGHLSIQKASLSGVGPENVHAAGSVRVSKPGISAQGKQKITGTAHVSVSKPVSSAAGKEKVSGSGSIRIPKPSVAAKNQQVIRGSGNLTVHKPSISSAGQVFPRASKLFVFSPL